MKQLWVFFFFFFLSPQQLNLSDDSVSALLHIKLNLKQYLNSVDHQFWVAVFCPIELEKCNIYQLHLLGELFNLFVSRLNVSVSKHSS